MARNKKIFGKFTPDNFSFKKGKNTYKLQKSYKDKEAPFYLLYEVSAAEKILVGQIRFVGWVEKTYWIAHRIIRHNDVSDSAHSFAFEGQIPTNSFAKQLFQNIFL